MGKGHGLNSIKRKPQLRALKTRRELIRAARRLFARDGFENARLEDIAAAAGKTRGAFYDHFADKEDVFFAIFEQDLEHYLRRMGQEFKSARTAEERLQALSRHFLRIVKDRQRSMLYLEFKIYAIRHPKRTKRLSDLQMAMCLRGTEGTVEALIPELRNRTMAAKRSHSAQFGAILDGLFVNRLFNAASLDEKQTTELLRLVLQRILRGEAG